MLLVLLPLAWLLFLFITSAETALESCCLMEVLQPVFKPMVKAYRCHCPPATEPEPLPGTSQRFLFSLRNRNQ